jgi:hypothetical protein
MSGIRLSLSPFTVQQKLRKSSTNNQFSGTNRTERLALDRSVQTFSSVF